MGTASIAFWNLQNLFDITVSPIAADLEFTPADGWDQEALDNKLANLAQIISMMNDGAGPDLLGICEVENRPLIEQLISQLNRTDYAIAHVDAPDIRGIDTSLIFSTEVFDLVGQPVGHLVHLRFATRDIFEVRLRAKENDAEFSVFVNHWPSRRAGAEASEAFRISVASHCGRLVDRVLKLSRPDFLALPDNQDSMDQLQTAWDKNVILMGDFNDEPSDRSVRDTLRSSNSEDRIEERLKPGKGMSIPSRESYLKAQSYLYNYMWPHVGTRDGGTIHFSRYGNSKTKQVFDQFIASRGVYFGLQGLRIDEETVKIFTPDEMLTSVPDNPEDRLKLHKIRPKAFDKKAKTGYSDHFPIEAKLEIL
jgi:hypothetical protein